MENNNISTELNGIELRSEKTRNIIGKIPSVLVRFGTSMFFVIIMGIILGSVFFNYSPTYEVDAALKQKSDTIFCTIKLPANIRSEIKIGDKVMLNFGNIPYIDAYDVESKIVNITSKLVVDKTGGYYYADGLNTTKPFSIAGKQTAIQGSLQVRATVFCTKRSYFKNALESVFSSF